MRELQRLLDPCPRSAGSAFLAGSSPARPCDNCLIVRPYLPASPVLAKRAPGYWSACAGHSRPARSIDPVGLGELAADAGELPDPLCIHLGDGQAGGEQRIDHAALMPGGSITRRSISISSAMKAMRSAMPSAVLVKRATCPSGRMQMSNDDFDMSMPTKRLV
jgi:hypothetical protein